MQRTPWRATPLAVIIATTFAFAPAQAASTSTHGPEAAVAARAHVEGATTLLVEDALPWGYDSNEQVLASLGVAYDTVGSSGFADIDLAPYTTIVVASVQSDHFYKAIGARAAAINDWLLHGARTLEFHAARQNDNARAFFKLPGGIGTRMDVQSVNYLSGTESPLVAGLPQSMNGSAASHVSFQRPKGMPPENVLIVTSSKHAVMLDYCVGPGRVIATGQTVEFAWVYGWDFAQVLPNMLSASTLTPGCPG